MPIPDYFATLKRFGLEELTRGDLVVKDGNIAFTRDGNLQFGSTRINALFRLAEAWRINESSLDRLFSSMLESSQRAAQVRAEREQLLGVWMANPPKWHQEEEALHDRETAAAVFAGAALVVLNNLLQRVRKDLNADSARWKSTKPLIHGYSFGAIVSAAANNFRHYDEWASMKHATPQQLESMEILCAVLGQPVRTNGHPTIRGNVCFEVLSTLSEGSLDHLYDLLFDFAKELAA